MGMVTQTDVLPCNPAIAPVKTSHLKFLDIKQKAFLLCPSPVDAI